MREVGQFPQTTLAATESRMSAAPDLHATVGDPRFGARPRCRLLRFSQSLCGAEAPRPVRTSPVYRPLFPAAEPCRHLPPPDKPNRPPPAAPTSSAAAAHTHSSFPTPSSARTPGSSSLSPCLVITSSLAVSSPRTAPPPTSWDSVPRLLTLPPRRRTR